MRYVVIAHDGTDAGAKERRASARPAHLEGIAAFVARGEVLVGGALLDEAGDMVGSVLIVDFATRAALDAWMENDPYVTQGVWQEIEIHDYRPAVGAWVPAG
jgi:hypothetical protein